MGTLGTGPFENDDALDFLDGVQGTPPERRGEPLLAALDHVLLAHGYVDAPEMCEAIAAAAVVGASVRPDQAAGEAYLPEWLAAEPLAVDDQLRERSRQLLHRALRNRENEWWELWAEAGGTAEAQADLQRVLGWFGDADD